MMDVLIRPAAAEDIATLCALLFEHGPNPWNHLPYDEVVAHLNGIASSEVAALLADSDGEVVGFVSYIRTGSFAAYQPSARRDVEHAYICEAVTHRAMAGRGLGSRLLKQVIATLAEQGVQDIYIERHEENAASAGMMRKAGFSELLSYADPARRPQGSGRTTLCCLRLV
ncbi:MAG: GNAT family N-acetyltransferase [Gammaproteobacteria bacterium]|nr:GNAT family N-acetyltransferase [Gammaproteobacteria bacterium]MBU1488637.1 GNAT family N-acetyltransferase [Gammaproteobacteria bacterium]MBU2064762.1 GNAT family N-acetyltransferase [Gammaproteobacteria bacterium]MBU2139444.1 GNAT family N-acetyltransferase [Gammaproteobacteria bacterium]MBU2218214.1 GNAT family N-acetyltransferase [Gammaproteobacteria bacterium]